MIKLRKRKVFGDFVKVDGCKICREKINVNVFKMLFVVMLVFFICWFVYFIMCKGIVGISILCNVLFI